MKLSVNPHIHAAYSSATIMWLVVLALVPAIIAGTIFFGISAFGIILCSVVSAVLTQLVIEKLMKKELKIKDGSAVVTGILLALTLPPTVPYYLPVLGSIFAVGLGKMIFGKGGNIFNPALIGRAFLVASWPALMSSYVINGITSATPLTGTKGVGTAVLSISKGILYKNLFIGGVAGCIGETSALALLIGGIFLIAIQVIDLRIPLAYLGTFAILAFALGVDPMFHLLTGGLMIGALFMATDYVTTPTTKKGRWIFGVGCGILTIVLRLYSRMPEGVMFSILFMNSLTPLIDRITKQRPMGR